MLYQKNEMENLIDILSANLATVPKDMMLRFKLRTVFDDTAIVQKEQAREYFKILKEMIKPLSKFAVIDFDFFIDAVDIRFEKTLNVTQRQIKDMLESSRKQEEPKKEDSNGKDAAAEGTQLREEDSSTTKSDLPPNSEGTTVS